MMMGLPTLRSFDHQQSARIWLVASAIDMRCGFDRLAEQARVVTGQDPFHGHLFLFRSRCGDRLKVLQWDRDGYVLWYKRLEVGVFKWPRIEHGSTSIELRPSEFAMLLDGIDMSRVKRMPRYERFSSEADKRRMNAG
jgi:transposase